MAAGRGGFRGAIGILVRILGPVEAQTDLGEPVPLGPLKQRALLAALMLRAGRAVTAAELVDVLWPTDPPRSALKNLQLYVHQLRKQLGLALPYGSGAYRVDAGRHRLDAAEFQELLASARRSAAAGDLDRARLTYDRALAWWRGRALADLVDRGLLAGEATVLEQARLAALEESVELEVRLSGPSAVLPRLHRLVADHPLHERFREHQVRGLVAAGRHGEASAAYQEACHVLAAELNVAPGPGLRAAGDTIDRDLPEVAPLAPAQLPADIADFTGRDGQVAAIGAHLAGEATAMRICAISGTAGVGKSTLAVHVAHRLRVHYPDGQLHVALHGQGAHRTDPADVLAQFLRALGQPTERLPVDLAERVRLYRSVLADRRVLVVLDDAASEDQVRPLLPGGPRCAAIVTSRTPLAGLCGARAVALDVLEQACAVDLLLAAAGRERVRDEIDAARKIVDLCGRLPLAVRVAGARLASRRHWSLARLAARLADRRHRLDELRAGDLDVRASFNLSHDGLDPATRRAFHLVALLDQPTLTSWLAGALLRVAPTVAERQLEKLVDAQLVQAVAGDRYRIHDLLRVYAAELARTSETATDRRRALDEAFAGWVTAAEQVAARMTGQGRAALDARSWFAAEQDDLVAAVRQAHRSGRWETTWRLAQALTTFLEERSQWSTWQQTHELAQDAARQAGDAVVEAALTQRLGELYRDRGRFGEAGRYFRRALELADEAGCGARRADALRGLGDVSWGRGDARTAVDHYLAALPLFESAGDRRGAAYALRGLSVAHRGLGRFDAASLAARRCVALFDALGERGGAAYARRTLGSIHLDLGEHARARACFVRCRDDFVELGDRLGEAAALLGLGMTQVDEGRYADALATYRSCRVAFADVADPLGAAYARRGLGDALAGLGRYDEAAGELAAALAVFVAQDDVRWQAYALLSLGRLDQLRGWPGPAREALHRALEIFERMAAPLWIDRTRLLLDAVPHSA